MNTPEFTIESFLVYLSDFKKHRPYNIKKHFGISDSAFSCMLLVVSFIDYPLIVNGIHVILAEEDDASIFLWNPEETV